MYKVEFILKMLCLIILFCLKINIACSNQVSFLYFNFLLIYLFNGTLVSFYQITGLQNIKVPIS